MWQWFSHFPDSRAGRMTSNRLTRARVDCIGRVSRRGLLSYGGDLIVSATPSFTRWWSELAGLTPELAHQCRRAKDGGEGGIRTPQDPLDSVSYRFHNAGIAMNATVAVAPCTLLHASATDPYLWRSGHHAPELERRASSRPHARQSKAARPSSIGFDHVLALHDHSSFVSQCGHNPLARDVEYIASRYVG